MKESYISNRINVSSDTISLLLAGAEYVKRSGGSFTAPFWNSNSSDIVDISRDEFFITGTSLVPITHLISAEEPINNWRIAFDVVFLWNLKPLLQSMISIDSLCQSKCYLDASIVLRSLHSKIQMMTLFSLNPNLYDKWLKEPKSEIFLDGHIRRELGNHSIYIYPHLYDWFSEVVHGQCLACSDFGYFEKGIFNDIPGLKNLIYTAGKFLFGIACWIGISALQLDRAEEKNSKEFEEVIELINAIRDEIMIPFRLEHFMTMYPEDRHLEKAGKNKFVIRCFDFDGYRRQLSLFHRKSQPKQMSKKYCYQ